MIIFTVTNRVTQKVYVGTTRNNLFNQWQKMVSAANENMDFPLYCEIRTHGADCFVVEEWDQAETRREWLELEQEALKLFNADSLRGYKTSTVTIKPKARSRSSKTPRVVLSQTPTPPTAVTELPTLTSPDFMAETEAFVVDEFVSDDFEPDDFTSDLLSKEESVVDELACDEPTADQLTAEEPLRQTPPPAATKPCPDQTESDLTEPLLAKKQTSNVIEKPADTAADQSVPSSQLSQFEIRVRDAIERHRKQRLRRCPDTLEDQRKKVALLLSELESQARQIQYRHTQTERSEPCQQSS